MTTHQDEILARAWQELEDEELARKLQQGLSPAHPPPARLRVAMRPPSPPPSAMVSLSGSAEGRSTNRITIDLTNNDSLVEELSRHVLPGHQHLLLDTGTPSPSLSPSLARVSDHPASLGSSASTLDDEALARAYQEGALSPPGTTPSAYQRELQERRDAELARKLVAEQERNARYTRMHLGLSSSPPPIRLEPSRAARYGPPDVSSSSDEDDATRAVLAEMLEQEQRPRRFWPPGVPVPRMTRSRAGPGPAGGRLNTERALATNDYEALLRLGDAIGKVEVGVSKATLASFPTTTWRAAPSDEHKCSVCLEPFREGEACKILTCTDKFHPACIDPWLAKHKQCPVCRHDLES